MFRSVFTACHFDHWANPCGSPEMNDLLGKSSHYRMTTILFTLPNLTYIFTLFGILQFYTNLESGKSFYSKDDVIGYIKSVQSQKSSPTSSRIKTQSGNSPVQVSLTPEHIFP